MLRIALAATAFMMSNMAFSAVTLSVPEEIKIVAVNDQEVKVGLFRASDTFKIDAGSNQISVRYTEYFQHYDNSHDILRSGVVTLTTPHLQDGSHYRLALIDAPKDFDAAKKYKDQPIIGLYNAQNKLLVQQSGASGVTKPWFATVGTDKVVDLTTPKVQQPASIYAEAGQDQQVVQHVQNTVTAVDQKSQLKRATTVDQGLASEALIQLWNKASKEERQKFMSWLATQSN